MRNAELLFYGVYADLRTEVARRLLGFLWWIIEPIMYVAVFYLVFGLGLRQGGDDYVPFLLCGMVPWKWFDGSVRQASGALVANIGLMQQVFVPKHLLVLIQLITNTVKFLVVLLVLLAFVLTLGKRPSIEWLGLFPLIAVQFVLVVSLGLLLGAVIPFAQDLKQIVDNVLMLAMFMSGIFFNADTLPESWQGYFQLNPMVRIIDGYREVLLHNRWPDWDGLGYVLLFSAPLLGLAMAILHRYERQYPKLIF
jgi:lipopolysaccharide transport system permease protein